MIKINSGKLLCALIVLEAKRIRQEDLVIEVVHGLPDNVVAVNCSGRVTKADYVTVLIPVVEAALKRHDKVRLFYRAGPEFELIDPSAVLEDAAVGFSHLSRWERVAVVTDVGWIRLAIRAFAFIIPAPVNFFGIAQEEAGRRWISEK